MAVVTIREIPDEVREQLARAARREGKSLQAYLLSVLRQQAQFARNVELAEMEPVGGGLMDMDEIVEAVHSSRGEAKGTGGDRRSA